MIFKPRMNDDKMDWWMNGLMDKWATSNWISIHQSNHPVIHQSV